MTNSYIAVDLETSGLDPKKDKIIEIGAIKVLEGKIAEEFSTFVNPRRILDPRITELTGITDQMICESPGIETVIEAVVSFSEDLPVLGHNVMFDYSFLKRAAVNQGIRFEKDGIDTLRICRRIMPAEEKKSLESACRYFSIKNQSAHRALSDAMAAHMLYQTMMGRYGSQMPEAFFQKALNYKVKRDRMATKRQKDHLRELAKYHRIDLSVEIEYLSGNEISRLTDKITSKHGRIIKR